MPEFSLGNSLLLGFLGFGLLMLIGFIYWIESKKPKQTADPIQKGIVLTVFIWAVLFLAEAFGFFEQHWNQKHFYIHLILAFCIVGIFLMVAIRKKPKSYEQQKVKVMNLIEEEYKAREYQGAAFFPLLIVYKLTIEDKKDPLSTRGEIGNFYVLAFNEAKPMTVWCQLNIYTLQVLHLQYDPPQEKITELYGKELPTSDFFSSQFEDQIERKEDVKPRE